jgi:hypothetical protein
MASSDRSRPIRAGASRMQARNDRSSPRSIPPLLRVRQSSLPSTARPRPSSSATHRAKGLCPASGRTGMRQSAPNDAPEHRVSIMLGRARTESTCGQSAGADALRPRGPCVNARRGAAVQESRSVGDALVVGLALVVGRGRPLGAIGAFVVNSVNGVGERRGGGCDVSSLADCGARAGGCCGGRPSHWCLPPVLSELRTTAPDCHA